MDFKYDILVLLRDFNDQLTSLLSKYEIQDWRASIEKRNAESNELVINISFDDILTLVQQKLTSSKASENRDFIVKKLNELGYTSFDDMRNAGPQDLWSFHSAIESLQ